jgi:hypothetical protein
MGSSLSADEVFAPTPRIGAVRHTVVSMTSVGWPWVAGGSLPSLGGGVGALRLREGSA